MAQQQGQCTPQGGSTAQVRLLCKSLQCSNLHSFQPISRHHSEDCCIASIRLSMVATEIVSANPAHVPPLPRTCRV